MPCGSTLIPSTGQISLRDDWGGIVAGGQTNFKLIMTSIDLPDQGSTNFDIDNHRGKTYWIWEALGSTEVVIRRTSPTPITGYNTQQNGVYLTGTGGRTTVTLEAQVNGGSWTGWRDGPTSSANLISNSNPYTLTYTDSIVTSGGTVYATTTTT